MDGGQVELMPQVFGFESVENFNDPFEYGRCFLGFGVLLFRGTRMTEDCKCRPRECQLQLVSCKAGQMKLQRQESVAVT
jgi:hypothetical protein